MWPSLRTAVRLGVLALTAAASTGLKVVDDVGALDIFADTSVAPTQVPVRSPAPTPAPTPAPVATRVTCSITLTGSILSIPPGSDARNILVIFILVQISQATGIPTIRFVLIAIRAGSIIADFEILPSEVASDPTPQEISDLILDQAEDPESALRTGELSPRLLALAVDGSDRDFDIPFQVEPTPAPTPAPIVGPKSPLVPRSFKLLSPKSFVMNVDPSRPDGGCTDKEQYMVVEAYGDVTNFKYYGLTLRQKTGLCGESISRSEQAEISGKLYATESGAGKYDGISIAACAPYGTYDVDYVIFDESETSTVSGELGVNVFRGFCEDDKAWKSVLTPITEGSYDIPPVYAGPNPNKAPECEADNYLGLGADAAPGAEVEGCYANSKKNPALADGYTMKNMKMDAKYCAKQCEGYKFFGTTDGDACVCSNKAPSTGVVTNCDTPCGGNSNVACGSCTAMTIFKFAASGGQPSPVHPSPVPGNAMYKYVDCFEDDGNTRVLGGPRKDSASSMTAQVCSKFCEGFMFFGTEYGEECYCGDKQPSGKSMGCNMQCTGDAGEKCGGRDAISVYKREGSGGPAPSPTSPSPEPPMSGCGKSDGCFKDYGYDRVLDAKSTMSKDMTAKVCAKFCGKYKYYGTENGDECFCGDSSPSKKASNCDMKCAGDGNEVCGGRDAITLYSSGSCPSHGGSTDGVKKIGCYEDDPLDRVLDGRKTTDVKNMNAKYCSSFCRGYKYFGTEWAQECFCGDTLPSKHSHDCDMVCKGNKDETCGGSNAITVYTRDDADADEGEMEHLGCYRDDGTNRIMKMASTESGSMTPKNCGEYCTKLNSSAKYSGVEFGKECFCSGNDDVMDKGPIGDGNCDMNCSGDSSKKCGGHDAMNVYKL